MIEIDIEKENKAITHEYKELLRISYQTLTPADKKLIRKAFDVAVDAHKEQRRKSGEAYIFHPIAVAKIVASEIGLGATSIAAALLHDVVEDTPITVEDIERLFNPKVAQLVEGLTKISLVQKDLNASMQAENFRKMILTLNDDVRVILIKLADRLHNMQTMDSMAEYKQTKIASETLYIYAPLAHRLGLYNIKTKLEDLGLKYTEPAVYEDIVSKIRETKEEQDAYIKDISDVLKKSLDAENIDYIIKGRPKSIYSIRRKMRAQNVSFDEVYDKFALRIVYKSDPHDEKFIAWKIYSIVTDHYRPSPSRLRDWISSPKSTGYEALHITVMGPKGRWVEVQVRSERMDEIAEKGYAAHYKYKNGASEESGLDVWLNLLREALENPETNAVDFVEDFKMNLYSKEIFIFTPKGEIKSLPKGATSLDFAFSIHSEIGIKTRGTRVNGRLVPLNHELKSGDQVEVITSANQKPTVNWLEYVTTSRAKNKIKNVLNENTKKIGEEGKELLTRKLKHLKITLNEQVTNELVNFFKLKTSLDLFYRVGIGAIENQQLKDYAAQKGNTFINFFKNKIKRNKDNTAAEDIHKPVISSNYDMLVFGTEHDKLDYKLSQCCNPIPGDDVFGFVTINEGIKVHKKDCPNAIGMQSNYAYRIMSAKWIDSSQEEFKAIINITGMDVLGLTNQLTRVISNNMSVNIQSISLSTDAGIFHGQIAVIVQNNTILKKMINAIKKIDGVDKVTREYRT
ncbi:bifunctional (p)ppGpp synthetase/guanosine-3',5'-bis(diphosphate) 3'-pyrophosphohydrolase [Flavobacterium sp. WLB]|uniref:Bifunctional (P)ppGpp synthetase/guanosine-3',5'-bis(Diphosphate) 3'-pyrophosphohydrolase n=1 Tax=Flavobacterium panici TaxID=2654843 RepID=A0A9N8J996_9FLAO|nr:MULTISPECIES: RelA/SpoT family protein [Flavobacterium]KOP39091.1 MFS transporter [Flavobacterium sp. VMW]MDR6761734.1 GTP pyrophosphokinase [Flavobacterium sp. 2755]OWU89250.1 MFS transporter [Flavobacterium sp. NLM]PUU68898.1 bifunctional (p)ppGpp synthetase/guanosine-3',5'-bis(diphosphate) 3'-pyrophosphohydrolase [Flavobacterium sp. WLB]UUF16819.1 RelA/SpoT family protein [Flavobacterium panici]